MTQAYPLAWPQQRPRTPPARRKDARFSTTRNSPSGFKRVQRLSVADALERLQAEIDRLGARNVVLSSNLELRLDGLPRSAQAEPSDPGVALYFQLKGKPHCLPCDTFDRAADNIAALAKHIEATRAIERYGVATVAEMFTGFLALPAPDATTPWWQILQVQPNATAEEIEAAYRRLARERHPDVGGSDTMMAELNRARQEAARARAS